MKYGHLRLNLSHGKKCGHTGSLKLAAALMLTALTLPACETGSSDDPSAEPLPSITVVKNNVVSRSQNTLMLDMEVMVVDENSQLYALVPDDFSISSIGANRAIRFERLSIEVIQAPAAGPHTASFVLDQSSSIADSDPRDQRIVAAKNFLSRLDAGDEVCLFAFATGGQLPREPVTRYLDDDGNECTRSPTGFDGPLNILSQTEAGGTPIYDAVGQALNDTPQLARNSNRSLILLTDGEDTSSVDHTIESVTSGSQNRNIPIHVVNLFPGVEVRDLIKLAHDTNGAYSLAAKAGELVSHYGAFADYLSGKAQLYRIRWRVVRQDGQSHEGQTGRYGSLMNINTPDGNLNTLIDVFF